MCSIRRSDCGSKNRAKPMPGSGSFEGIVYVQRSWDVSVFVKRRFSLGVGVLYFN